MKSCQGAGCPRRFPHTHPRKHSTYISIHMCIHFEYLHIYLLAKIRKHKVIPFESKKNNAPAHVSRLVARLDLTHVAFDMIYEVFTVSL